MKFVLKNRIAFIVFCLLLTPPVFSSETIQQKKISYTGKFLALSNFFRNPSFSGATSFFAEHAVGSIGLLSCLGLGIGTVTLLSPTVAVGLGCSLGYFSLFGNLALKELLFRTKKIDSGLQDHYKKAEVNHQETTNNINDVKKEVVDLKTQVTTVQSIVEKNQKENANNFKNVNTQLRSLESTVKSNHQESTKQLSILQNTQKQINREVVSVQSSLNCLTETVQKHNTVSVQANKEFKEDLKSLKNDVKETHMDLKSVSEKTSFLEKNTQEMQQAIQTNEFNAQQRDEENKNNHIKTQLKLAIIEEGQQQTNTGLQNVVSELGSLRSTVQENHVEVKEKQEEIFTKMIDFTNQLLNKQENLENELAANKKQLEEITHANGTMSSNIDYLVQKAKQKEKTISDTSISFAQQQQKITEDELLKAFFFTKSVLEMSRQKVQQPTEGQAESGKNNNFDLD